MKNSLSELSPEKRQLLAQLLKQQGVGAPQVQMITRRETDGPAPLSYAQQRLWFLHQFQKVEDGIYSVPWVARLRGMLRVEVLERCLSEIVRRHESLRTSFSDEQGQPIQTVHPAELVKAQILELNAQSGINRDQELAGLIREQLRVPFDITRGPLLRAVLVRLEAEEHVLIVVMHHIASDGWSQSILTRELGGLYEAYCAGKSSPLKDLPIQYADYAIWQRNWLQGEVLKKQLDYWRRQLDGVGALEMPTDHPRPAVLSHRGASDEITIAPELSERLKRLSQREGVTFFVTLLAALQLLLHYYSGQDDITVGSPIAGRVRTETEGLIGFFVNTLVLRADLMQDPTFAELLQRVKKVTLDAYANQDVPFEKLVEELHPERDMSRTPFFQVMFAWQNTKQEKLTLPGLEVTQRTFSPNSTEDGTAKFDLALLLSETDGQLKGELEYNKDLFEASTIARMIRHFTVLLEEVVEDPEQRISEISLMTEEDLDPAKGEFRGEHEIGVPDTKANTLPNLVGLRAQHNPDAYALIADDAALTYAELNQLVDRFALRLQSAGVTCGSRVVVCAQKAANVAIAALAVMRAGAIFIPVNAIEPPARKLWILNDSGASLIATEQQLREQFSDVKCIFIEEPTEITSAAREAVRQEINPDNTACMIYQSGPSGYPAGVPLQHKALCLPIFGQGLDFESSDRIAMEMDCNHEGTSLDMFAALAAGACIIGIPFDPPLPRRRVAMLLRDQKATILMTSAAALQRLANEFPWALRTQRLIFCDDEVYIMDCLPDSLRPEIAARTYGFYGSPEIGGRKFLYPIGGATSGTLRNFHVAKGDRIFVLDRHQRPVPQGIHGELCIGSRTERKGTPLHHTGEFVRLRNDGTLELRGRHDRRVKIRGVRVHPEEIEVALVQHPSVCEAVVLARKNQGVRGPSLAALVVLSKDAIISSEELRSFLEQRLPDALIPEAFTFVDAVPHMAQGQPDYKAALHSLESQEQGVAYVAPRNEMETQIAEIWAQMLAGEQIGIHDNFFRRGGHSLLATQLAARMSDAFHVEISLRRIFETPTIAAMSKLVENLMQTEIKQKLPRITAARRVAQTPPVPVSNQAAVETAIQSKNDLS